MINDVPASAGCDIDTGPEGIDKTLPWLGRIIIDPFIMLHICLLPLIFSVPGILLAHFSGD